MKITLAPVGSLGDVRPLIALGIELRNRGDTITICAPPNFEKMISNYGFVFYPVGEDIQAAIQKIGTELMGKPIRALKVIMKYWREMISAQYAGIFTAAKGSDLLVGAGVQFMGSAVAEALEIPYIFVCHVPQMFESGHHPPPIIPWQNLPIFINQALWSGFKMLLMNTLCKTINNCRRKVGVKRLENAKCWGAKKEILAMDKELGPLPLDVHTSYLQTGYWNLVEEGELGHELDKFIKSGDTPIYIGFGSMTDPSPEKTSCIIKESLALLNIRAVISKGWAGLCKDLKSDTVFLTDPVPHVNLFPRMKAIIHHGGAGTSWSASRAGVPQVLVPHGMDQYYWANRIYKLKLGPHPINRSNLTGNNLASAINMAITDIEIKESCLKMQKRIHQRNGVKEAVKQFNSFCLNKI